MRAGYVTVSNSNKGASESMNSVTEIGVLECKSDCAGPISNPSKKCYDLGEDIN